MGVGPVLVVGGGPIGPFGDHDQGDAQRQPILGHGYGGAAGVHRLNVVTAGFHDVRATDRSGQALTVEGEVVHQSQAHVWVEGDEHLSL